MLSQLKLLAIAKVISLAAVFLVSSTATNATGALDPTFGANGRAAVVVGDSAETEARAIVVQPDGKIIVAGYAILGNMGRDIVLVRFNADGSPDTSFGNNGRVVFAVSNRNENINSVALQPNGRIVVVGSTQPIQGSTVTDFLVVRFTSDGGLDASFGNNGVVTVNQGSSDVFNAVVVQPDGKIVAAGSTSDCGCAAVARFNSNGSPDTIFGGGLIFLDLPNFRQENLSAIALAANGRILVGGLAQPFNPNFPTPLGYSNVLVLLESDGQVVQSFGNQGVASAGAAHFAYDLDLAVLPDGKILTTGANTIRFLSNGTVDPTFQAGGVGSEIALRSDGKFIVINRESNFLSTASYTSVYANDGRFVGRARNLGGNDVALQPDNKILLISSTQTEFVVTRLTGVTSQGTRIADYDDDDKTDIAVLRLSNSTLYVLRSTAGFIAFPSGEASFEVRRVIPERYGNPLRFPFVYWKSASIIGSPASFCGLDATGNRQCFQWGLSGDAPVGGDYDGDTLTDIAVYRPQNGTWYIYQSSNNQFRAVQWGVPEDKPVPADYDYDGITDIAVYRPSNGFWYVRRSSDGGLTAIQWGVSTDIPLTGDFDADGRADFVVYRPQNGTWYLLNTTQGFRAVQFGISTDQPVPGDYDGDGRHDVAVFRNGIWYVLGSTRGFYAVQWGLSNDVPVAIRYAY